MFPLSFTFPLSSLLSLPLVSLFDVRKKGDRPLPPSENIFNIMEDWKKSSKKPEEECRFVFKLKSSMNEDVVEDPVRVHLLYLEAKYDLISGLLTPGEEEMLSLAALEMQVRFLFLFFSENTLIPFHNLFLLSFSSTN